MNTLRKQLSYKRLTIVEKDDLFKYILDNCGNPFTKSRLDEVSTEIINQYTDIIESYPPNGWERVCELVKNCDGSKVSVLRRSNCIDVSDLIVRLTNPDEQVVSLSDSGKICITNVTIPDIYMPKGKDIIVYCPQMYSHSKLMLGGDYIQELGGLVYPLKQLSLEYAYIHVSYWELFRRFILPQNYLSMDIRYRFLSHIETWGSLRKEYPDLYDVLFNKHKEELLGDGYELSGSMAAKEINELLFKDLNSE